MANPEVGRGRDPEPEAPWSAVGPNYEAAAGQPTGPPAPPRDELEEIAT